MKFDTKLI